ncbi:MAG: hypothetical protein LBH14_06715 [Desulfobulbaceae bacterium]|jgi:hypothetical protein|nr:hypothetical protein [Desulfobulbaceae bacterium]
MKYEIRQAPPFEKWFSGLKDALAKQRILARLARVENGNLGDYKVFDASLNCEYFTAQATAYMEESGTGAFSFSWWVAIKRHSKAI